MSSRVSIPPNVHLIGSMQPPRPRPSRVDPRGLFGRVTPRLNAASSSHALVIRVRNLSAALLFLASLGLPCGRPRRPTALKEPSASPGYVLLRHTGPFDACRPTLARPTRATLRLHADRPGLPLPALLASWICRPCFMPDRPWAPSLQRFLPVRRRMPLSEHAVLHAVSHLAVPRLQGCQPSLGCVLLTATLFTPPTGRSSPGCSPPSR
jgi:hypothetical protein